MKARPADIPPRIPKVSTHLGESTRLVLQAPPGAGKTTRLPLALLDAPWLHGQTILILEPRRLAARTAAMFMARECGDEVGKTIGYRVRFENRISPVTRIEVITEGILTRRLQDDPGLGVADYQTTCGYTKLYATGPDRFLIVYSDFQHLDEGGQQCKAIKVREIVVRG